MQTITSASCRVLTEADLSSPIRVPGVGHEFAIQSVRRPGKEDANDDAALVYQWSDGSCVMAVADGVGGAPLGNQASAVAMRCLQEQLRSADPSVDLRPRILDSIEQANTEILDVQTGSATTLTVAEIRGNTARIYQVGDSMAVILGGRGLMKYRTVSHSPVGYAVESGYLTDDDAMHHDDRHYVSNLVGSKQMSIEVGPAIELAKRDIVLLGSDGLFDNLMLDEIVKLCLKGDAEIRVNSLVSLSRERMDYLDPIRPCKPDDLTVVLRRPC
ncbi:MAG: protein phosphatase 2C domain-containing protein [Planctomycetota bacterium]